MTFVVDSAKMASRLRPQAWDGEARQKLDDVGEVCTFAAYSPGFQQLTYLGCQGVEKQMNYIDCGVFVLAWIIAAFERATSPQKISISNFLKTDVARIRRAFLLPAILLYGVRTRITAPMGDNNGSGDEGVGEYAAGRLFLIITKD